MKTAEEWADEFKWVPFEHPAVSEFIKQIQLDAFKAGMSEAAEIASYMALGAEDGHYNAAFSQTQHAILTARDDKTEI